MVLEAPVDGTDLCAMYQMIEEAPDISPQQYGDNRGKVHTKTNMQELIKHHLQAFSKFPQAELEAAIDDIDKASVNGSVNGSVVGSD